MRWAGLLDVKVCRVHENLFGLPTRSVYRIVSDCRCRGVEFDSVVRLWISLKALLRQALGYGSLYLVETLVQSKVGAYYVWQGGWVLNIRRVGSCWGVKLLLLLQVSG